MKNPREPHTTATRAAPREGLGDGGGRDVERFDAFAALALRELHLCTFGERLEAVPRDVAVMNEEVLTALVGRDEPVPLRIVEPLHGSGCHRKTPPCQTHERAGKALCAT